MTNMSTIRLRAFAAFWWFLHGLIVAVSLIVLLSASMHPRDDLVPVTILALIPIAALAVTRWIVTGRWRLGPRW